MCICVRENGGGWWQEGLLERNAGVGYNMIKRRDNGGKGEGRRGKRVKRNEGKRDKKKEEKKKSE